MATVRTISLRLKSVRNIQKITKSMKMVSAAKYARAERDLKKARPLGEGSLQFYIKNDIQEIEEDKEQAKPKTKLYIAVSSDRGLCGAIHTSISKHIRNVLLADNISRDSSKIICIGDKARSILQRLFPDKFLLVCTEPRHDKGAYQVNEADGFVGRLPPTFLDASKIANQILKSDFEFDIGKIIYNRFHSVVSYVTSEITLFNVNTVLNNDKITNYVDFDPETVRSYVEMSIAGLLYYALKEGSCSEQSARMTAMDNASKNAEEMISKLTLTYNRTRQAAITSELIEIISGASAV